MEGKIGQVERIGRKGLIEEVGDVVAVVERKRITRTRYAEGRIEVRRMSRASAGRSNGSRSGRVVAAEDHFKDVKEALNRWIAAHDPGFCCGGSYIWQGKY